jgi:4'-phosphopantetheinyl transferase
MSNIDVWLAFYNEIGDERSLSRMLELLNDAERAQQVRFYFADDRQRYLVTRALVRTVLSKYMAIEPCDWRFGANSYGRPEIANLPPEECSLRFNISHTRGLTALAVAHRREIGVDVENTQTREVSLNIADRFFAPSEVAALARVPTDRQQERFFEYWTFKESYIKARGMGLHIPLDQFSFDYPHAQGVRFGVEPKLGDVAGRWRFWQFRPSSAHLLALCAERLHEEATSLTFRRVIPTVEEEILPLTATRASDD